MTLNYLPQANKLSNRTATTLSVPSKTFLLGEYAVLHGAPGILINTEPRFQLHAQTATQQQIYGIPNNSPARQFILANSTVFQNMHLSFYDPHNHRGGLGASSAQFVLSYHLADYLTHLDHPTPIKKHHNDYTALLTSYQHYAWDHIGLVPSGYDLIAQINGQLTYYHQAQQHLQIGHWPFTDAGFYLLHTGHKIATHEHLKELSDIPYTALGQIVEQAAVALQHTRLSQLTQSINEYARVLAANHWVTHHTAHLLTELHQQPGVLAAKGCGALGADIVLVIVEQTHKPHIQHWATQYKLRIIADETMISHGITKDIPK